MKIKNILVTGDDGYKSIGIRILIKILKSKYNLQIAATKKQQSGIGGCLSLEGNKKWGEDIVDGVPAVWVDGTPADVTEFSQGYFKKKFDLVISGINWGENVGYFELNSSGTFSAAFRFIGVGLSINSIAFSWVKPSTEWTKEHYEKCSMKDFLEYPGEIANQIIESCIRNNFYKATIINVNFPHNKTNKIKITKNDHIMTRYFKYPVDIDYKNKTYKYPKETYARNKDKISVKYDTGALAKGYISITPIKL
jgi:5'-nucleotidase